MLSDDQIRELKNQLKQQIEHLPADKRAAAESQIESLSSDALEELLNEQNEKRSSPAENKSIFRRIVDGDVPAVKIAENSVASAYLDITPISKGNSIILPKRPITDAKKLPTGAFTLAKKIASRIITKLGAKTTEIQTENKFGESYISIVPSYEKQLNINSPRKSAKIEELEPIAELIRVKKRAKKTKPAVMPVAPKPKSTSIQLPRRIP